MLGPRRITATLTIEDFSVLMSNDIESVVLSILKNKYQGVCYSKCFIISVDKIIHVSDIEFNQNDISNCSCNVNIIFDCTVEVVYPGEIIKDLNVLSTEKSIVTLGDHNKIAIIKAKMTLAKGSKAEGTCLKAIYEPGSDKIKIGCRLVQPSDRIIPKVGVIHVAENVIAENKPLVHNTLSGQPTNYISVDSGKFVEPVEGAIHFEADRFKEILISRYNTLKE